MTPTTPDDFGSSAVSPRSNTRPVIAVGLIWAALTCAWAFWYVSAHTHSPDAAGYERQGDFQLLMFAIFRLPWALVLLVVVETVTVRSAKMIVTAETKALAFSVLALSVTLTSAVGTAPALTSGTQVPWAPLEGLMWPILLAAPAFAFLACATARIRPAASGVACMVAAALSMLGVTIAAGSSFDRLVLPVAMLAVPFAGAAGVVRAYLRENG